jgi:hypothetical protein
MRKKDNLKIRGKYLCTVWYVPKLVVLFSDDKPLLVAARSLPSRTLTATDTVVRAARKSLDATMTSSSTPSLAFARVPASQLNTQLTFKSY